MKKKFFCCLSLFIFFLAAFLIVQPIWSNKEEVAVEEKIVFDETIKTLFPNLEGGFLYRYEDAYNAETKYDIAPDFFTQYLQNSNFDSFLAIGKIETDSFDLFVVRATNAENAMKHIRKDFLFVIKNGVLLNEPFQISQINNDDPEADKKTYYFDWENNLNTVFIKTVSSNKKYLFCIRKHKTYQIASDPVRFSNYTEKEDTLFHAQTFEQFNAIFPILQEQTPSHENRLLTNNRFTKDLFDFQDQKVHAIGKISVDDYDLFFVKATDDDNYRGSDNHVLYTEYVLLYKAGVYLNAEVIGYEVNSEGGLYFKNHLLNPDNSLTISTREEACCSASGYDTPIGTQFNYRLTWNEKGFVKSPKQQIEFFSPFFNPNELKALAVGEYFPKKNSAWILWEEELNPEDEEDENVFQLGFYLETTKTGSHCVQFFTRCIIDDEIKLVDTKQICDGTLDESPTQATNTESITIDFSATITSGKEQILIQNGRFY